MDVEAADSEGIHGRPAGLAIGALGPGERCLGNRERPPFPIEILVEFSGRCPRWNEAVFHGQHHLHETRHAGSFEGVTDVGLHTADGDFLPGR